MSSVCRVLGIGPTHAHDFVYNYGVRTLEDLDKLKPKLNYIQLLGMLVVIVFAVAIVAVVAAIVIFAVAVVVVPILLLFMLKYL